MATKKKSTPVESGSQTSTHKKLSEAQKQVESFLNAISEKDCITLEMFTTANGYQVTVSIHKK